MMYDQTESRKSNMAASELEVPTSQIVDKIGTYEISTAINVFGVQLSNGIGCDADQHNWTWRFQDGGL